MIRFEASLNLADYFLYQRIREGDGARKAILFGERVYSYADVAARCDGLRRYFQSLGLRREERVLVVLPDVPPFAWSLMAIFAEGAVACMGNPHAPKEDIEHLVNYTRATVVITTREVASSISEHISGLDHLRAVLLAPHAKTGEDPCAAVPLPTLGEISFEVHALSEAVDHGTRLGPPTKKETHRDDVCMWLFSSGSTGRAKAAMHTHRDFAYNTEVFAKRTLGYSRSDITLSVPRLFFGYATGTNLFFPMAVGGATALYSERCTPGTLASMVETYKPTIVTNVPTMMEKLLQHDEQHDEETLDLSSVRFHLSAGEALPPALLERFCDRFDAQVYDGIGSAEMFHIYCSNGPKGVFPGSLGRAVDGYELKILPRDALGPSAPEVDEGEVGVLWVKGDSVALGYFQDRDASWSTFHGHWCRTGDLFRRDSNRCYWFCGRDDDLFKVSGIWVSPIEVENCLMVHPHVSMAAVVAICQGGLNKPRAYVVLRKRVAGDHSLKVELQNFCKTNLSIHKYPREVVFVEELPRNDRGKIDRKALKEFEV